MRKEEVEIIILNMWTYNVVKGNVTIYNDIRKFIY